MNLIYIIDLEGTLTKSSWRSIHAELGDWEEFQKLFPHDDPNVDIIEICNSIALSGRTVWIITGKEESGRSDAVGWLKSNNVNYSALFMRPNGNKMPSPEFKERFITGDNAHNIALAFDDRQDVVDMFRCNNIPAILVEEN